MLQTARRGEIQHLNAPLRLHVAFNTKPTAATGVWSLQPHEHFEQFLALTCPADTLALAYAYCHKGEVKRAL